MKMRTLILLALIGFTTIPVGVFQAINYWQERELLLATVSSDLESVANIQHKRILSMLANKHRVTSLVKNQLTFNSFLTSPNRGEPQKIWSQLRALANGTVEANQEILGVAVFGAEEDLLFASHDFINEINVPDLIFDKASDYKVKVQYIGLIQSLIFIEPIKLRSDLIGYIAIAFADTELNSIVSDYTGLGETGEIVLAARESNGDALFLTPTRHDPTVALNLTVPRDNLKIPITHAMNGVDDIFPDYVDYRNIPVLAISHHIPEADWGMIVKMDKTEAFHKLELLKSQSLKTAAALLLIVISISVVIVKWASRPFTTIQQAMLDISKGKSAEIARHSRIKEIEEVTLAFNQMAKELECSEEFLHESIRELTNLNIKLDSEAERFKRWKESNFIGIIHSDARGRVIDANSTVLEMIGYSKEELDQGLIDWKKLTPEKYFIKDVKAINEANEKGYWTPFEKAYLHKEGHEVPILIGGSIFNENNQEFIVFVVNLSEKYEQLRELEQYKGIIENSRDMFAFVDRNYRYRTVNKAYLGLCHKSRSEVIGHLVSDIVGERYFNVVLKSKIDEVLNGKMVTFIESRERGDKVTKTLKISYIPYRSNNGQILGYIFKGEDITELAKKQKTIELKEAEQKHIIESMLEGVITTDDRGIILSFNPEAENIFGYKEKEIIGQSVTTLTNGVVGHDHKIRNFIDTGESSIIDKRLGTDVTAKRKDGTTFPLRIAVASMPLTEKGEHHFIANFQDMSEQERQSRLLNRSLKLESLGKVAGGVAHDFNNILGIVLGYTDLLAEDLQDKKTCITAIEKACARGQKLTSDLLTFAKKTNKSSVNVDINDLLLKNRELLETVMTSKINLELELGSNVGIVNIDDSLFENVLLNMSINAMHAMPSGGDFRIRTQACNLSSMEANTLGVEGTKFVKITLTDTGAGISKDNLDKIFDPFFTTKEDFGNGLGLSQCYGFVKSCGGLIDVVSELGVGSTFTIYLPVIVDIEEGFTQHQNELLCDLPSSLKKVLIVDDEEDIRHLVKCFLQGKVDAFETGDPNEAIRILETEDIDFIISDVIMPKVGGSELIQMAKQVVPDIPYLFISGFISPDDEADIEKHQILYKPFNKQQIFKKITKVYNASLI